ncbi:MAG TPA: hypothetical protein VFB74_20150 [Kribbellaceae bacterium]|nr:hypothetical protein [Kribbellaceae bacterium]
MVVTHREDAAPEDVVLVPVAGDADPTVFSIFIERLGANLNNSWPGKNADGSLFVGRIPMAAGTGTCCVVAVQAPLQPRRAEMPRPTDDALRQMREWAVNGVLVTTVIGEFTDGAIALIDLRADPSVVTRIDSALSLTAGHSGHYLWTPTHLGMVVCLINALSAARPDSDLVRSS